MTPTTQKLGPYALVYLRPDGWWSAGDGWETVEAARKDGQAHDWRGRSWGIVSADVLEDIEGDLRLPIDLEPTHLEAEGSFHD